jgi:hypothetical protein
MNEHPVESSEPTVTSAPQTFGQEHQPESDHEHDHDSGTHVNREPAEKADRRPATVIVKGETVKSTAPSTDSNAKVKEKAPKPVSAAKVKMQDRLPALEDDADVGVQKKHLVSRDDKADLAFTGTLLASAAPTSAMHGHWEEYRVYETDGGKHVFSKVNRTVYAEEQDSHEAETFDPSPSSVPSQLLRSARELTRSKPLTWTDAAVHFFGYTPLAKVLYRKLGDQFDEHIS